MNKNTNFANAISNHYGFKCEMYRTLNEFGYWTLKISIPPDRFDGFSRLPKGRIISRLDGLFKKLNDVFPLIEQHPASLGKLPESGRSVGHSSELLGD